jgi:uncharacterized membrane protein YhaH (DUF805 family)
VFAQDGRIKARSPGVGLFNLLFGFRGRITRLQYWLGSAGAGIGGAILFFAFSLIIVPADASATPTPTQATMAMLSFGVVSLLMGWAGLALQVKRFHDRGRSGFFALAPLGPWMMIVMTVGGGIATDAPATVVVPQILPWLGVLMLVNLWLVVDLGLLSGTSGPNKYDHTPGSSGGGGAPVVPGAPRRGGSSLGGAEAALERALAEQKLRAQAAPHRPTPARPAAASAQPAFGRRVVQ